MATSGSTKKQIIDSIKDVTNILVTVSKNPSVDELSAAMGLTIFLNKLGKHATAVASGTMPDAISFLDPAKTFEGSADSLRDFIIALDKDKADHLRYKLDGDVVKIFITPYRTTITSEDLEFSQGDYNVEMVIGLNVVNEADLDSALSSHGKILHDATVATITSGDVISQLGTIDWHDQRVSSVSEMVTTVIDELKTDEASVDEQISTALLTGIVAATDRFSNDKTSSGVMTVAASLMASGANQQLIVAQLAESESKQQDIPEPEQAETEKINKDETVLEVDTSTKLSKKQQKIEAKGQQDDKDGVMRIEHEKRDLDEVAREVAQEAQAEAAVEAQEQLEEHTVTAPEKKRELVIEPPVAESTTEQIEQSTLTPPVNITEELRREVENTQVSEPLDDRSTPLIGGTLNATTDQAAQDKKREIERDQNRTILSHAKPISDSEPMIDRPPINAAMDASEETPSVDIFAQSSALPPVVASQPSTSHQNDLLNSALTAAESAPVVLSPLPVEPINMDQAPNPTLADLATMSNQNNETHTGMPTMPPLPPMPDFNSLPPLPPMPTGMVASDVVSPVVPQTQQQDNFNPSQFQIPGQQ